MFMFKLQPPKNNRVASFWLIITIMAALVILLGCERPPIGVVPTNNYQFQVEKLFEIEGCAVYRFHDDGSHYLTLCPGSVQENVNCGKGCYHKNRIETKFKKGASCNALEH